MSKVPQSVPQALGWFLPDSIRGQILAFAVLAALIPALVVAVIAYAQNRRALTDKITQELVTAAAQSGRETDVWLKERLYDLRVFASSYVVSDALAHGGNTARIAEYLRSVRARFGDYEELQLIDPRGRLVASNPPGARPAPLPAEWAKTLDSARSFVGEPYWDANAKKLVVILGVPVERINGQITGALLARANYAGLAQRLRAFATSGVERVYLTTASGRLIVDSVEGSAGRNARELGKNIAASLVAEGYAVSEFRAADGVATLASARRLARTGWLAVADLPVAEAYRQANDLRMVTLLVVGTLLLVFSVIAYQLAVLIARPLARLTGAARKVSSGDLSVELPAGGSGEVAYLTQVFNTMIASLRSHREDLERISTTDVLTGLTNRRQLMNVLSVELDRARRGKQPFSILMLDVDHFKKYNDAHGHQAGDEVLARIGAILRESIRPYDCAARYGGEEFLVMISGAGREAARDVGERVRKRVAAEVFDEGRVTLSVGLAEYPAHGGSAEAVIAQADAALYEAKRAGRNRVVVSDGPRSKKKR